VLAAGEGDYDEAVREGRVQLNLQDPHLKDTVVMYPYNAEYW
jgi:hypothetical protein